MFFKICFILYVLSVLFTCMNTYHIRDSCLKRAWDHLELELELIVNSHFRMLQTLFHTFLFLKMASGLPFFFFFFVLCVFHIHAVPVEAREGDGSALTGAIGGWEEPSAC